MNIIRRLSGWKSRFVRDSLPSYCFKSKFFTKLYYFFFDHSFDREMKAVLSGKVKHINDANVEKANYYMLVRNVHRLEKGLSMQQRRDIFGKDFIVETLRCFDGVWDSKSDNKQMKWFFDVLENYFEVVAYGDATIDSCRERFNQIVTLEDQGSCKESRSIPYRRDASPKSNISYDEFLKLARQRRSVRWFLNKTVDRSLIDKAILLANLSPSACNRQPFEFRVFDDLDLIKKVVNIPMGTRGYGQTIPVFVVLVGNLDAYFHERDRHVIYIDGALAAMSFMFGLETLGLGSCAINWPDIELKELEMSQFLGLNKFQRPLMCIGLGHADPNGLVAYSEKRPLEMIRNYNKFSNGN